MVRYICRVDGMNDVSLRVLHQNQHERKTGILIAQRQIYMVYLKHKNRQKNKTTTFQSSGNRKLQAITNEFRVGSRVAFCVPALSCKYSDSRWTNEYLQSWRNIHMEWGALSYQHRVRRIGGEGLILHVLDFLSTCSSMSRATAGPSTGIELPWKPSG